MENKNCKDMIRQEINEVANSAYRILETFLLEYCKVHNIGKGDIGSHLYVKQDPNKGVTSIIHDGKDLLRLAFISVNNTEGKVFVRYDVYLSDKLTYRETLSLIKEAA